MNIMPFIIAAMLFLVQFSVYAQSTGQVTLSIKLCPIQIIEVDLITSQTVEVTVDDIHSFINHNPSPQKLATYSTSHYALKVDSIQSASFQKLRSSSAVPPQNNRSKNKFIDTERYENETDEDDFYIVYSMETL